MNCHPYILFIFREMIFPLALPIFTNIHTAEYSQEVKGAILSSNKVQFNQLHLQKSVYSWGSNAMHSDSFIPGDVHIQHGASFIPGDVHIQHGASPGKMILSL